MNNIIASCTSDKYELRYYNNNWQCLLTEYQNLPPNSCPPGWKPDPSIPNTCIVNDLVMSVNSYGYANGLPLCDSNCASCAHPGFCSKCNDGFYISATGICTSCDSACKTCSGSSNNQCTSCNTGFTLSSNGTTCNCNVPNSLTCNSDGTVTSCNTGYVLSPDQKSCICADLNATSCDSAGIPLGCVDGYYKGSNSICTKCSGTNVVSCDFVTGLPEKCLTGYSINTNITSNINCDRCVSDAFGMSCTSTGVATACHTGFVLNSSNICVCNSGLYGAFDVNGKPTCKTCNDNNADICDSSGTTITCKNNTFLYNNICTPCASLANVINCNSDSTATSCNTGYKVSGGLCIPIETPFTCPSGLIQNLNSKDQSTLCKRPLAISMFMYIGGSSMTTANKTNNATGIYIHSNVKSLLLEKGINGSLYGINQLVDLSFVGIGGSGHLYTSPSITGTWSQISSDTYLSIAPLFDGTFLAVKTDSSFNNSTIVFLSTLTSSPSIVRCNTTSPVFITQFIDGSLALLDTNGVLYTAPVSNTWSIIKFTQINTQLSSLQSIIQLFDSTYVYTTMPNSNIYYTTNLAMSGTQITGESGVYLSRYIPIALPQGFAYTGTTLSTGQCSIARYSSPFHPVDGSSCFKTVYFHQDLTKTLPASQNFGCAYAVIQLLDTSYLAIGEYDNGLYWKPDSSAVPVLAAVPSPNKYISLTQLYDGSFLFITTQYKLMYRQGLTLNADIGITITNDPGTLVYVTQFNDGSLAFVDSSGNLYISNLPSSFNTTTAIILGAPYKPSTPISTIVQLTDGTFVYSTMNNCAIFSSSDISLNNGVPIGSETAVYLMKTLKEM